MKETASAVLRSGADVMAVLVAVGESLRDFHAVLLAEAPAASSRAGRPHPSVQLGPSALLDQARLRVDSGSVDSAAFDAPYRRYSPEQLLDLAERGRPDEPAGADLVAVVGSARLDTVLLDGDRITGWIVAQGGQEGSPEMSPVAGDRYRDLATMAVDLAAQVSPEALGPFLDAYGLDHPDVVRLDWHVLVDQLLR